MSATATCQRYIMEPNNEDHGLLFDLIWKMLRYDPLARVTLKEALKDPFFKKSCYLGGRARSHSLSR